MAGKRLKSAREGIDRNKRYDLGEAVAMIKAHGAAKFDETVEIATHDPAVAHRVNQPFRDAAQRGLSVRDLPRVEPGRAGLHRGSSLRGRIAVSALAGGTGAR